MKSEAEIRKRIAELDKGAYERLKGMSRHDIAGSILRFMLMLGEAKEIEALKWVLDAKGAKEKEEVSEGRGSLSGG